jgi:hypothetical protein
MISLQSRLMKQNRHHQHFRWSPFETHSSIVEIFIIWDKRQIPCRNAKGDMFVHVAEYGCWFCMGHQSIKQSDQSSHHGFRRFPTTRQTMRSNHRIQLTLSLLRSVLRSYLFPTGGWLPVTTILRWISEWQMLWTWVLCRSFCVKMATLQMIWKLESTTNGQYHEHNRPRGNDRSMS